MEWLGRKKEDIILNNIKKEDLDINVNIGEIVQGDTVSYDVDGVKVI